MKRVYHLPLLLLFLIAIAFSIKSLREPDLWWQIRTGEWIWQHGQVPKQDVFSYTMDSTPWVNVKWGTEVLYALLTRAGGPELVFLLQALVSCLLLFFLWKLARLVTRSTVSTSFASSLALWLALSFTLVGISYRINGRPEMISHLFTVVFLFFLLRNREHPSAKIFWLLPLQALWANLHEAFGIGIVLVAIFCVGEWITYFLAKRKIVLEKIEVPKRLTWLLPGVAAAVLLNPNGVLLLTKPLNILGQVYANKFTTELFDFRSPEFWQWPAYWAIGLALLGGLGVALSYFYKKKKQKTNESFVPELGISYWLTLAAFFYLASTAYRNVVFFALVLFPLLYSSLDRVLLYVKFTVRASRFTTAACCVSLCCFYWFLVSGNFYALSGSRDRFGMEVLASYNPVGAAAFIEQHTLRGKCFSDYLTSSYLLWKLQPDFKTFIDLRDLDVFPAEFFNTFAEAVTFPEKFRQLDSTYHFDYVVLYRPQFATLHQLLYRDSAYQLQFVDAVAAVYQKTKTKSAAVPDFSTLAQVPVSAIAYACNKLLYPFYQPMDYGKYNNDYLAASFFMQAGDLRRAEQYARRAAALSVERYKGEEIMGEVLYNKALQATTAVEKDSLLLASGNYFRQSMKEKDDFADTYLGMGAVYFQQQNYTAALHYFERGAALDKSNLNARLFAAQCCLYFSNRNTAESKTYTQKAITYYRQADALNPDNPSILLQLGFLYFRLNDCSRSSSYLRRVVSFEGLSPAEKQQAENCLRQCGS